MAMIAEKKLALSYTNSQEFIQNEAMLTGQIQILQYLIAASDAALTELRSTNQVI
jgi:hypothetical protein